MPWSYSRVRNLPFTSHVTTPAKRQDKESGLPRLLTNVKGSSCIKRKLLVGGVKSTIKYVPNLERSTKVCKNAESLHKMASLGKKAAKTDIDKH